MFHAVSLLDFICFKHSQKKIRYNNHKAHSLHFQVDIWLNTCNTPKNHLFQIKIRSNRGNIHFFDVLYTSTYIYGQLIRGSSIHHLSICLWYDKNNAMMVQNNNSKKVPSSKYSFFFTDCGVKLFTHLTYVVCRNVYNVSICGICLKFWNVLKKV